MSEKKPKTLQDIRKEYPNNIVTKTEEGFFVTQNYGYIMLNRYGNYVNGICVAESL